MDQLENKVLTEEIQDAQTGPNTEAIPEQKISILKKISKKTLMIIGAGLAVIIALAVILFIPSEFERVQDEAIQIAGIASTGDDYFTINTKEVLLAENALDAIKYANEELGFGDSVYSEMMETTALMGRQSEENEKYEVSWTYHPNRGLNVTYKEK